MYNYLYYKNNMKKRFWIVTPILFFIGLLTGGFLYIQRASFPTLRMFLRDQIYNLRGESVINTDIIQKELSKMGIPSVDWKYQNADLNQIEDLSLLILKHSIVELDLSELRYLKNLKKLFIAREREYGVNTPRDRSISLTGLNKLENLAELTIYELPFTYLDGLDFPRSLKNLDLDTLWLQEFRNREELKKIPNLTIFVGIDGADRDFLFEQKDFVEITDK